MKVTGYTVLRKITRKCYYLEVNCCVLKQIASDQKMTAR